MSMEAVIQRDVGKAGEFIADNANPGITWAQVEDWIITWAPIIFMALLVLFIWRTMRLMPRTKPTEITPDSDSSISWSEVAGADEAKAELQEIVEFLRDPERFTRMGATV